MPNLQAVFEKYPEYRTMCTAPDGHIYSFPWIEQLGAGKEAIQAIGDVPYINKKWLDIFQILPVNSAYIYLSDFLME